MTERDMLLGAICEHPDEDTPRLAFADWLDENDNPDRAAFIRLQCELAGIDPSSPQAAALRIRADELLEAHHLKRTGFSASNGLCVRFHRGFVHAMGSTFKRVDDEMMREMRILWSKNPIQQIVLRGARPEHLHEIAGSIGSKLNALHLRESVVEHDTLIALLGSLTRGRIRTLQFAGSNGLTDGHVQMLSESERLRNLEELTIAAEPAITDVGMRAIAASPHLVNLKYLTISYNHITHHGLESILRSKQLESLRYVEAAGNEGIEMHGSVTDAIRDVRERISVRLQAEDPEVEYEQEKMARRAGYNYPFFFRHW